jgi:hypothetical protein
VEEYLQIQCYRDLEEIKIYDFGARYPFTIDEFDAIASLPLLKHLDLEFRLEEEDAVSPLAKCKGLRHHRGSIHIRLLSDVLAVIGRNLVDLECYFQGVEGMEIIANYCPNLERLDIWHVEEAGEWEDLDDEARLFVEGLLKNGLKKLSEFGINGPP